jgi:putative lipoic acid-binding regulatory protein
MYICRQFYFMNEKTEEFYKRLKAELENTTEKWPTEYLYKFIIPASEAKIALIEKAFNNMGAVIKTNKSKNGNYSSVSINVIMPSADAIIEKYKEVSTIEGIISL